MTAEVAGATEDWLAALGLSEYAQRFAEDHIDMAVLRDLTDQDLRDLGVSSLGHRRKLMRAIGELSGEVMDPKGSKSVATPAPTRHDGAERRHLTVMFTDLVGSTALSTRLDPEDLRAVIGAYHKCVVETIERFGGFVAKYMGDGVLAYFGYPRAHEDDAERAVRAGLVLIDAVRRLSTLEPLQVRLGVATGLVVVGDLVGSGEAQECGIVGETPNLAARLLTAAAPDTIVIDPMTRRLLVELFEYRDLGGIEVKGFATSVQAYQVVRASTVESRFEALHATTTPLVGRDEEINLLTRRWRHAKDGNGSVVLIVGEPGIGKSRIAQEILERLKDEPHRRLRFFCSPHYQDTELYPITTQLERLAGFRRDDSVEQRLNKLEALLSHASSDLSWAVPLLADLLSIPSGGHYQPLSFSHQKRKERTLLAMVALLEAATARQPVLMVLEDVHWSDATSLELLDLCIDRAPTLRVLIIVTFRPEFAPPWIGRPEVTLLALSRLPPRQRAEMITHMTGGKMLPKAITDQIVERTDGVPLFVEELTKAVVESGILVESRDGYAVTGPVARLAIPTTLHGSLLARLDHLAPTREIAQIGAALGRSFSHELISAVAGMPQQELDDALAQLVNAELIWRRGTPPDAKYTFKHALVQDAAYSTLIRSRRQRLHRRIVTVFQRQFPETVTAQPALLAMHCAEAGLTEAALDYWLRAGQQATSRFAMKEAVAHLSNGIALLTALPQGRARDEREIDFRLALAVPLIAMHGYGSAPVEACAARAKDLSHGLGDYQTRFAVYRVVWNSSLLRRPVPQSVGLAHELMALAANADNPARLAIAHRALGYSVHIAGAQAEADRLLAEGIVIADGVPDSEFAVFGEHPGMICRGYRGSARCLRGFLDDGVRLAEAAVQHARTRRNPFSLAWALMCGCHCYLWRRDTTTTERLALEAVAVSSNHGLPQWLAFAQQSLGLAICSRGELQAGIDLQEKAMRSLHETGSVLHTTRFRLHLAESFLMRGDLKQARSHLDAGLKHVESHGETYLAVELCRIEALLLNAEGAAEEMLQGTVKKGLALARRQGARLLELRLALVITRLLTKKGKYVEARALLAPIYECFTEGLDTPDLEEAKVLLGELARSCATPHESPCDPSGIIQPLLFPSLPPAAS
ncbi:MAG: AAA family ATPase [Bradyrhizobium sp.]|nr:AAA family ATPase [Bradyrhizobium sp.]